MAWIVEALNETVDAEHRPSPIHRRREQRVVILRAFVKKTEKTPAGEIELGLQRAIGAGMTTIRLRTTVSKRSSNSRVVLRTLLFGANHGHAIAKHIQRSSEDLLQVETGSLYPALHESESL